MIDRNDPEIDVDLLMREIRAEISSRMAPKAQPPISVDPARSNGNGTVLDRITLPRLAEAVDALQRKQAYTVADFLVFHDEDFVRNAYRGVLGREPDAEGGARFLAKLRSGDLARVEVLGRIRFSPEGRARAVPVKGLLVAFGLCALRRVPVAGHALAWVEHLLELPRTARERERLVGALFREQAEMRRGINAMVGDVEAALQRIRAIEQGKADRATLDAMVADLRATLTALRRNEAD